MVLYCTDCDCDCDNVCVSDIDWYGMVWTYIHLCYHLPQVAPSTRTVTVTGDVPVPMTVTVSYCDCACACANDCDCGCLCDYDCECYGAASLLPLAPGGSPELQSIHPGAPHTHIYTYTIHTHNTYTSQGGMSREGVSRECVKTMSSFAIFRRPYSAA